MSQYWELMEDPKKLKLEDQFVRSRTSNQMRVDALILVVERDQIVVEQ